MPQVGKPNSAKPQWVVVQVKLNFRSNGRLPVSAYRHGAVVVHKHVVEVNEDQSFVRDELWTVSLVETGLRLATVKERADALRIGLELNKMFHLIISSRTADVVKANLPLWVERWLDDCNESQEYRPFVNYQPRE